MAVQNKYQCWTIQASAALTDLRAGVGELYKAIGITGDIAAAGNTTLGILQYGADNGGHVSLGIQGVMKFVAGAAVTAGTRLTVTTSGYFTTAGSGSYVVGRNLDTAVASGAVGTGFFDFSAPYFLTSSN